MSEHNYERNADAEIERLRGIIDEVHSWAVCGAIATPEDMAQGLPRIVEITTPDWHGSAEPEDTTAQGLRLPNEQRGYVDWMMLLLVVMGVAMTALVAGVIVGAREDNRRWEAFKVKHECKVVGKISGDVFNTVGFGADGKVSIGVGSTPDKTGWACNDGVTYYR